MSIRTTYRGTTYRSRLEARWAAFFDQIGWKHTYEPIDGDGYIPDFLIHGDRKMLVEIKPASDAHDYAKPIDKMVDGLINHFGGDLLILGVDPFPTLPNGWDDTMPPAGLIGQRYGWHDEGDRGWSFDTACWITCGHCSAVSVFHSTDLYASRPCGHYDGDHYLMPADQITLRGAWAAATNRVQWHAGASA